MNALKVFYLTFMVAWFNISCQVGSTSSSLRLYPSSANWTISLAASCMLHALSNLRAAFWLSRWAWYRNRRRNLGCHHKNLPWILNAALTAVSRLKKHLVHTLTRATVYLPTDHSILKLPHPDWEYSMKLFVGCIIISSLRTLLCPNNTHV